MHYKTAKVLAGSKGNDLVHHCYLLVHDKLDSVVHPDAYFQRTMRNQMSEKDSFKRQQSVIHPKVKTSSITGANTSRIEDDTSEIDALDLILVREIVEEIRNEGYEAEVQVFDLKAKGMTVSAISEKTKVCRATLAECINFVVETVKERYERYERLDTN